MHVAVAIIAGLVAFALPCAVRLWRARRWGLPVRIKVDPDAPSAEDIAGYFATLAQRLDERPERMSLVIDGRTSDRRAIALDFLQDGSMQVDVEGDSPKRFSLRKRWIPDHSVPLDLRSCRLWIEPVDANRFRVMETLPFRVNPAIYVLCSVLATVGVVCLSLECVTASASLGLGCIAVRTWK